MANTPAKISQVGDVLPDQGRVAALSESLSEHHKHPSIHERFISFNRFHGEKFNLPHKSKKAIEPAKKQPGRGRVAQLLLLPQGERIAPSKVPAQASYIACNL
jgi:hypothetical protein